MGPDNERLKMAMLLFLSTIIKGSKIYGHIDPFILRIVDDLDACQKFPWGRYTFDHVMEGIANMMDNFKGVAKPTWCFPGFIIPLELLACEAIPDLGMKFREDDPTADRGCPRMCKRKWRKQRSGGYLKGFPLEDINEALGSEEADAQRIISILQPDVYEEELLSRIFEDDIDEGDCYLSLNWNSCLVDCKKKIFWQDVFDLDKAGRALPVRRKEKLSASIEDENVRSEDVLGEFKETMMKMMEEGLEKMNKGLEKMNKGLEALEGRVVSLEKLPAIVGRVLNNRFAALEKRVVSVEKNIEVGDNDEGERVVEVEGDGADVEAEGGGEDFERDGEGFERDGEGFEGEREGVEAEREGVEAEGEGVEAESEREGFEGEGEGEGVEAEAEGEGVEAEGEGEGDVEAAASPSIEDGKRKTCPSRFKRSPFV